MSLIPRLSLFLRWSYGQVSVYISGTDCGVVFDSSLLCFSSYEWEGKIEEDSELLMVSNFVVSCVDPWSGLVESQIHKIVLLGMFS